MTSFLWVIVGLWGFDICVRLWGLGAGKYPVTITADIVAWGLLLKLVLITWALILLLT